MNNFGKYVGSFYAKQDDQKNNFYNQFTRK